MPAVPVDLSAFKKYVARIRSEATATHYCASVETFLGWVEKTHGRVAINLLPRTALMDYSQSLLEAKYATGTIEAHLAAVKRYFRWIHEHQDVKIPNFHTVELPKETRKVRDILSPEMLTHFFRAATTLYEPLRTAVMLLPCSGLRSNEMATLPVGAARRSPFRLADGTTKDTLCLVVKGKGGHERIVPLLDEGAALLLNYLKTWRHDHKDAKYMFPGRYVGEHLSTRAMRDGVQSIRGAFKLNFTPHTLRRTYLTMLYRKGVEPTMLAKIAGHKNVQILIDHYLALDEQDVVRAVHKTGGNLTTGGHDGN